MRERVEAFIADGGRAIFHDAYGPTSHDGKPLKTAKLGGKTAVEIRQDDGVHLTEDAVEFLLVNPIVEMVLPCFPKTETKDTKKAAGN